MLLSGGFGLTGRGLCCTGGFNAIRRYAIHLAMRASARLIWCAPSSYRFSSTADAVKVETRRHGRRCGNDAPPRGGVDECAAPPSLRPPTSEGYEGHVHKHIVPVLGHIALANSTALNVQRQLNEKVASGLAPRTVHYMHTVLRRALNQAVRRDHVARNVATLVGKPRAKTKEFVPLTPDKARTFLKAFRGDRLEALYTVALAPGLRKREALGLSWDDVDFTSRQLSVFASMQRVRGKRERVEPKAEKSRRRIALPEIVVTALRRHKTRQLRERLLAGERRQEHGLVFTTTIGTPIDGRKINGYFKSILARAGLSPKRFHDLRHTCASLLLAQGVHPRVVMDILGHSTIGLTMNSYSHVIPALQQEAVGLTRALLKERT